MTTKKDPIPDFLIVGAAKCGTTSLAYYLNQHPKINLSEPKEPRYLTFESLENKGYEGPGDHVPKKNAVKSIEQYKSLFSREDSVTIQGEASVDTLFYAQQTIGKIKNELGEPKIIILLRDPVKRAVSAYSHLVREEREDLSFEQALLKEKERIEKGYEQIWAYVEGGKYYEKVKAFCEAFDNVEVIIFEDFVKDTQVGVNEVLDFLDISEKHEFKDQTHNRSGKPKNAIINRFMTKRSRFKTVLKYVIGKDRGVYLKNKIQERNLEPITVEDSLKKELYRTFEKDIQLLEEFLKKDLSIWKKY